MILRIPVMCWAHGFTLLEVFSWATHENSFDLQFVLSLHTLSHTQPIQRNPTYNTGYIRLNRITIKFVTELKPIQISCKSQLYMLEIGRVTIYLNYRAPSSFCKLMLLYVFLVTKLLDFTTICVDESNWLNSHLKLGSKSKVNTSKVQRKRPQQRTILEEI